jgi:hypothetical protein
MRGTYLTRLPNRKKEARRPRWFLRRARFYGAADHYAKAERNCNKNLKNDFHHDLEMADDGASSQDTSLTRERRVAYYLRSRVRLVCCCHSFSR